MKPTSKFSSAININRSFQKGNKKVELQKKRSSLKLNETDSEEPSSASSFGDSDEEKPI